MNTWSFVPPFEWNTGLTKKFGFFCMILQKNPNDFFGQPSRFLRDFPGSSVGKESSCNAGDTGSIPGSRRSPGKRNDNTLQYSCLGNPLDRGAWEATVHRASKSRTQLKQLSNHYIGFPDGSSGKESASQCSSYSRHGFDPWVKKITWRRKWQLTPVFLLGKAYGQRSFVGCSL